MTKEATACGRTNHSPQSKEQSSERLGDIGAYKGERPPLAGGRTRAVDSFSPTHKGSINQEASSVRGSFGALPLRPTAMIRRTSHEVLLCVAMVLINRAFPQRVTRSERPLHQRLQHRFAFNEDGRSDRAFLQRVTRSERPSLLKVTEFMFYKSLLVW